MKWLVMESWMTLLLVELRMRLRGFQSLHERVQKQKVNSRSTLSKPTAESISHAVDLACVFYYRRLSPLERSAAAALMLRRYGWPAELVLGVQVFPYESYAWVEVERRIVNDQPNLLETWQVIERC